MATYNDSAPRAPFFANLFAGIASFYDAISKVSPVVRDLEALSSLSDEELAERGLAREDLVRHVAKHYGMI